MTQVNRNCQEHISSVLTSWSFISSRNGEWFFHVRIFEGYYLFWSSHTNFSKWVSSALSYWTLPWASASSYRLLEAEGFICVAGILCLTLIFLPFTVIFHFLDGSMSLFHMYFDLFFMCFCAISFKTYCIALVVFR